MWAIALSWHRRQGTDWKKCVFFKVSTSSTLFKYWPWICFTHNRTIEHTNSDSFINTHKNENFKLYWMLQDFKMSRLQDSIFWHNVKTLVYIHIVCMICVRAEQTVTYGSESIEWTLFRVDKTNSMVLRKYNARWSLVTYNWIPLYTFN